jgi:hypothetical protein
MSSNNLTDTKNEIKKGLQFLTTLNQNGPVYAMLRPILDDLKLQIEQNESIQASAESMNVSTDGAPTRGDYDAIVASIHKVIKYIHTYKIYIYVYVYIYVYIYVYMYIYTYIFISMYTYMYIFMYMCIWCMYSKGL